MLLKKTISESSIYKVRKWPKLIQLSNDQAVELEDVTFKVQCVKF